MRFVRVETFVNMMLTNHSFSKNRASSALSYVWPSSFVPVAGSVCICHRGKCLPRTWDIFKSCKLTHGCSTSICLAQAFDTQTKLALCCFGDLPVMQVFGGDIQSSILLEASYDSKHKHNLFLILLHMRG